MTLDRLACRYGQTPAAYLVGSAHHFDLDACVAAFACWYEDEMSRLPQTSSDMVREMRHRELIAPPRADAPAPEAEGRPPVDVLAIIARAVDHQ